MIYYVQEVKTKSIRVARTWVSVCEIHKGESIMFTKSTWMSKGYISQAKKFLAHVAKNEDGSFDQKEIDGAKEGLACLVGASPGYLVNLIKTDHPDRVVAVRLLTSQ